MTLETGQACPPFALPDQDGVTVRREDLAGVPFVLYFYPKDDTSGCTNEAKAFSELAESFRSLGVAVLGVSPDSAAKHAKFRLKHGLSVRLLADEEKALIGPAGLWIEKSMYGRNYMGVDRTTLLVDADGRIVRIWPKVKVPGHADDVLEAARQVAS